MADASNLKALTDVFSAWIPVASAFIGGVLAIAGGVVTQLIIACKEKKAQEMKVAAERAFIGAGLILFLREYSYQCNRVSSDSGELRPVAGGEMEQTPIYQPLFPAIEDIEGNWTVIPGELLLRIRQIPMSQQRHERYLTVEKDVHDDYPQHNAYFKERTARYTKLSNECSILERELRQLCGFPQKKDQTKEPKKT